MQRDGMAVKIKMLMEQNEDLEEELRESIEKRDELEEELGVMEEENGELKGQNERLTKQLKEANKKNVKLQHLLAKIRGFQTSFANAFSKELDSVVDVETFESSTESLSSIEEV